MSRATAVSLFSGAGGLDLGAERAGVDVLFAVENNLAAIDTLTANRDTFFPTLVDPKPLDITTLEPEQVLRHVGAASGEIDLLIGGPPCVAFSKSGFHLEYKREGRDPRAGLLWDYLRFLDGVRPRAFVMENVFGLAYRNQSAQFFQGLLEGMRALGYDVSYSVLNAADFGVPQNRQRLFIVGSLAGDGFIFPEPTHWGEHERRKPPANVASLLAHVTCGVALVGLSTVPEPGESVNGKYGHLLPDIPPGGNYLFYTAHEGHPRPLFEWRSRYWTFLLKLDPDRPSPTLQAQPGPYVGPFHWENRRLRVPELKRLHGFPDEFEFPFSRRDIQMQIGNAVPPPLAEVVIRSVLARLS